MLAQIADLSAIKADYYIPEQSFVTSTEVRIRSHIQREPQHRGRRGAVITYWQSTTYFDRRCVMPATNVISENTSVQAQAAAWISAAQTIDAGQANILVASADPAARQVLAGALRERDVAVLLAHDRGLALRTIVWQLPDLVILDTQLAGDDAIDLCVSLKADRRTRSIPILVTTAAYDAHEHLRAIEAGADDYLARSNTQLVLARARALLRARRHGDMVPLESVLKTLEQTV